ncbi:MAG TPA: ChbG/HpnK family deacetylase [Spirochaetota bacterium]|nr:ChbG/HpnK family deacetylase [Spirochaetota bacterium]
MTRKNELIITADDFGLSPAINRAITDLYIKKAVTRTSLLINSEFTGNALSLMQKQCPDMPVGIHLTLTCGRCCSNTKDIPLLSDASGNMKLTYGKLLLLIMNPFTKKKILRQIEIEFEAQLMTLKKRNIRVSHMDGHQHVHMMPGIFPIVAKLAEKNAVPDVRIVNENFFLTRRSLNRTAKVSPAGLVKFVILKVFSIIAMSGQSRYFFSILHSCRMKPGMIDFEKFIQLSDRFDVIEIMLHPGDGAYDNAYSDMIDPREKKQALSPLRKDEYSAAIEIKMEIDRRKEMNQT